MSHSLSEINRLLATGQANAAEILLADLVAKPNAELNTHSLYAQSLFAQGKVKQAIGYLEQLQKTSEPTSPQINADLGEMLLRCNQYDKAQQQFKAALEQAPRAGQLWHILGIAQYRAGEKANALASFAKSEQFDHFQPQLEIAEQSLENNEQERFLQVLDQVLQHMPVHPKAAWLKASWLMQEGQVEQAASQLATALNYAPYNEALLHTMALVQVQLCDLEAALNTATMLLDVEPSKHDYWLMKADIEQNMGKLATSLNSFEQALKLGATPGTTKLQMAYQQHSLGDNESAIGTFRSCLDEQDCVGSAFWGLSTLSDYQATEEEQQKLAELQWDTNLSPEQACQVSFSLARAAEKVGDHEEAFAHYENANNLKPGTRYSPQKMENKFSAIKKTFNKAFFDTANKLEFDSSEPTPIFITGLPRTGSTLTEQILSSHSLVEATMELKVMPAVARRAWLMSCNKTGNNEGDLSCLNGKELTGLGNYYLQLSKTYRTGKPYFIDKLPPNYQHIGLIAKILPQAIIIDTRRNPMAWGMAVYRQYFAQGHDFSYDFDHIAHAYHNYLDLMAHWNECLPNKIYLMQYESLVTDTEDQVRELLQHCGLDFEQACLASHKQSRYVKTASSDQVRKPIYQTSISSWKNYEHLLSDLKQSYQTYGISSP